MSSNKAYTAKIEQIVKHPTADKLMIATILGYKVIVGLDDKVGDQGILFLPDAIISSDVVAKFQLNYLSDNRVRVVKLRGEYSDGVFITISDEEIAKFGGIDAMWREYQRPTKPKKNNLQPVKKQNDLRSVVPKHMDTEQYLANKAIIDTAPEGTLVSYTVKTHGTSGITAKVFKPLQPSKLEAMLQNALGYCGLWKWYDKYEEHLESKYASRFETTTSIITGSRNVLFTDDKPNWRTEISSWFSDGMHPNEIIYYEILGYKLSETLIMDAFKGVPYDYGLAKGEAGIQIYRITQNGVDLLPDALDKRAKELGIPTVKRIHTDCAEYAFEYAHGYKKCETFNQYGLTETSYDHLNEGIVIRLDYPAGTKPKLYKWKFRDFLIQEGILKPQVDGDTDE